MKIEVITIGNELLDGRRVDTNTTWIGHQLSQCGLALAYRQSVNDDHADIQAALLMAVKRADMVICTGGLGPTLDDITFQAVAAASGQVLVFNDAVFAGIAQKLKARGRSMPASNERQAWLPKGAHVLENRHGTAPGISLQILNTPVFVFPGVPHEMQSMFTAHISPTLNQRQGKAVHRFGFSFFGLAEAAIEERILADLVSMNLRDEVAYSITASFPVTRFVFRVDAVLGKALEKRIKEKVFSQYSQYLWSFDEKNIEQHVILKLKDKGMRLQVAESTSGGMLASTLVDVPGCSDVFEQGLVTYSNASKVALLGVARQTLDQYGAVSSQCALEMARGLLTQHGADVGVATTGIAGPTGGSAQKPVGRTYIAWAGPGFESVQAYDFMGDRLRNRILTTYHALIELYQRM